MINVNLFKCNSYDESDVRGAIDSIVSSFPVLKTIKKGSKVVIKANLVSAMNPDKCATTHPSLLKELTSYLLSKECSVVIGDSPGGPYNESYLKGIYKATRMADTDAKLNDNFNITKVSFNKAKVLKSFEYTSYLDDADVKINFCKLKTHGMMGLSASVKNLFGTIPGVIKPEYHYRFPNHNDFANMLIDINEYFKFDVNIVDAVYGMEGNGPTMGLPRKIGLLLASDNPYALDYICAKIINLNPLDINTINESLNRKLFDIDKIRLNDDIETYVIKDYKTIKNIHSIRFYDNRKGIFKIVSYFSNVIFSNKPKCKKNKCIGCQKCKNICPAGAITMVKGKPKIDRKKCIKCYCCQEFCPVGAMKVKTSLLMRIIKH